MKFEEILKSRRAIRNYQNKPVSIDIIKEIIKDSTLAPSAGNGQPWKYIVVNNKELLKKMSDDSKNNMLARIAANPNDYAKKYEVMLNKETYNIFYNAPCAVIIIGQKDLKNLYVDCALAASYFMMSATSRGLGTCWVNFALAIKDPEIIQELGIPEKWQMVAPLVLGYPEKITPVPERKEPEIIKIIT